MYIAYGCVFEDQIMRDSLWKFNFASKRWTLVSDISGDGICNYISEKVGSKLYFLFGVLPLGISNKVFYIDLLETIPKTVILSPDWDSPSNRKNHCSVVIRDCIYIFGGITSAGVYLNDLWYFDIPNYIWIYVVASGDIPAAKKFAACTVVSDTNILVFGGTDPTTIFNDFFVYSEQANFWKSMENVSGFSPSPRYSACILYYMYYAFIVGGRDDLGLFNEVWVHDYLHRKYLLIETDKNFAIEVYDYKCWIDDAEGLAIYLIGGQHLYNNPSDAVIKIDI